MDKAKTWAAKFQEVMAEKPATLDVIGSRLTFGVTDTGRIRVAIAPASHHDGGAIAMLDPEQAIQVRDWLIGIYGLPQGVYVYDPKEHALPGTWKRM